MRARPFSLSALLTALLTALLALAACRPAPAQSVTPLPPSAPGGNAQQGVPGNGTPGSDVKLWLRPGNLYHDTGKTAVATAGQTALVWADSGGSGLDATVGTGQTAPTAATVGGLQAASFGGANGLTLGNPAALNLSALSGYSVFVVAEATGSQYNTILSKTGASVVDTRVWLLFGAGNGHVVNQSHLVNVVPTATGTLYLIEYTYAATGPATATEQIRVNGSYDTGPVATTPPAWDTADPWNIGAANTGGAFLTGYVGEVLIVGHKVNEAERVGYERYFGAEWGIAGPPVNLVCDGNSLTYGFNASSGAGLTTGTSYPGQLATSLAKPTWQAWNVGAGGQSGNYMAGKVPSVAQQYYNPLAAQNFYFFWEGTNDLAAFGLTPAQSRQTTVNTCLGAKSIGYQVGVLDCLPRGSAAGFETTRSAYNALMAADFAPTSTPRVLASAPYADLLAQIGSDPAIGVAGSQSNATNYGPDLTHLTDAGYAIPAAYVKTLVTLMTTTPTAPPAPLAPADSVHLTWAAVPGAASYSVYKGGVLVGTSPTPSLYYAAGAGVSGAYTVTAANALGASSASPTVNAAPAAPASLVLTVTGTGTSRTLTWTADPQTPYVVERYLGQTYAPGASDTILAVTAPGVGTFTDTARPAGPVRYKVTAIH